MSFMNNKGIPNALTGGQGGMMNALSSLDMKPGMNKPVAQGQGGALTNVLSSIENWGQNNLRRGSGPLAEAFHGFAQGFAPQQYENARQGRMGEIAQEQAQRGNVQQQITGMNEQQAQMQREMQESALAMGQHLLTMPEEQRVAFVRQNWQRFGPMVSGGKNNMSFEQWMAQDPTGLSDMDLQNDIAAAMTQMRQGPQYEVTNDQYIRMDQGAPRVALDARDAVTVDPDDRLATQTGQVLLGPDEEYVGRENRTLDIRQQEADTGRINANRPSGPLVSVNTGDQAPQIGTIPPGYQAVRDQEGNVRFQRIPGGPAEDESAANQDTVQFRFANASERHNTAVDALDRALSRVNPATTGWGGLLADIPASDQRALRNDIDTIKNLISVDSLENMRMSSPTGGALGNVTERELELLSSLRGRLDQLERPEDVTRALTEIRESLNRIQAERQDIYNRATRSADSGRAPPPDVDPMDWEYMSPEERELFGGGQ